MAYQDLRLSGFQMTSAQKQALFESRYHSDAALHLNFEMNGHDAFVMLNPELASIISSIYALDKKLTRLSNSIPSEALRQFVANSLIEEIQQSNEVENVESTRKEIKDTYYALEKGTRGKRFVGMVRKYMLLQSEKEIPLVSCQDIRNLYNEFICDEVVREDPEDAPDGVIFRKEVVHVSSIHGENIHEGLYPESRIISAMDTVLTILNDDTNDILVRTALFHYFFGYIHPFYNGNGRMARFISSYVLSKQFSGAACLRISYVIKEHRSRYYELFRHANDPRNMGEVTEFVMGYLRFFREAIEDTCQILEDKYQLYTKYERILDSMVDEHLHHLSFAQKYCFKYMLQTDLFGESILDIYAIAEVMECSTKTARKILADAGTLVRYTKEGNRQIWHINLDVLNPE